MKKKIQAELVSIAHRVLQLKADTSLPQLQEEARQLYEKLTLLSFAEQHFSGPQPTIGQVHAIIEDIDATGKEELRSAPSQETAEVSQKITETATTDTPQSREHVLEQPLGVVKDLFQELDTKLPEELLPKEKEATDKPEFIIDKVNADISEDLFVPATAEEINSILQSENLLKESGNFQKNDMEDVAPLVDDHKSKSLNERLKKNITIGLNDRLAFIKHLFDGSSADYNRVLSQLNTVTTPQDASDFINNMVKPDHNNWEGKEPYEQRFLEIVAGRFD